MILWKLRNITSKRIKILHKVSLYIIYFYVTFLRLYFYFVFYFTEAYLSPGTAETVCPSCKSQSTWGAGDPWAEQLTWDPLAFENVKWEGGSNRKTGPWIWLFTPATTIIIIIVISYYERISEYLFCKLLFVSTKTFIYLLKKLYHLLSKQ